MGTGLLLFGSMALFLIIGVPIAFALGAAVWTTIVFSPDFLVTTGIIGQRIFGGLESTSIMAIPFFILAGNLMTKGGISKRLVDFANSIVGGVRGGMALALVLACAFFAALSVLSPIRCKTLLDGGRRRTKNLYGVFKRTVPAGQVRQ